MFPIELINKILNYVADLNDSIMILQYELISNKEIYKINFNSNFLYNIRSNLLMKQYYPLRTNVFTTKSSIELYKNGIDHYEKKLKLNKIK